MTTIKWTELVVEDYQQLFSLLKRNFGGYRFQEDSEVETTGTRWLITLDMDGYQHGTQELVQRYDKFSYGADYVEKH